MKVVNCASNAVRVVNLYSRANCWKKLLSWSSLSSDCRNMREMMVGGKCELRGIEIDYCLTPIAFQ